MSPDSGPGFPGWFIALFVVAVLVGVGSVIWRVSVARRIAEDAGLDPDTATKVALLSGDGIDATYVASVVAASRRPQAQGAPPPKTTTERLKELEAVKEQGLITDTEYETQRQRILGSM